MSTLISIIVPNHGRDLTELNNSLINSKLRDFELLVIDIGKERSYQRNVGIKKARGEYLLILDSDQSISPCLLTECVNLMKMGYSSVYIPEVIVANSFFGKIRAFERSFYTGTAIDVPRFIRRFMCPLFDEKLSGPEDAAWGNRIQGFRAISRACLYHHDDISLKEYCRKKAYYTKSMKEYEKKWPNDKCLDLRYRCFGVFVENGKWKKILKHPVLFIGVLAILAIRGFIYFTKKG